MIFDPPRTVLGVEDVFALYTAEGLSDEIPQRAALLDRDFHALLLAQTDDLLPANEMALVRQAAK